MRSLLLFLWCASLPAQAGALELDAHAVLPAATQVAAPRDAPVDLRHAGKFTGPGNLRNREVGSAPATTGPGSGNRPTGLALPFRGQAVQGISGIVDAGDGTWWALSDNGFGTRRNSPDAMLMIHRLRIDFARGTVRRLETVFLRDPRAVIGYRITHEGTRGRYLTGADLDPESLVADADGFWIGDEFGPYLLRFDRDGVLREWHATRLDGALLRSPDHHAPEPADPRTAQRSGGFEALAAEPGARRLWALLEKPLLDAQGRPEGPFVRMLAFDPARGEWTGETRRVPLAADATAVGDLAFDAGGAAWILERGGGEGDPGRGCAPGTASDECFANPARHRRLVRLRLGDADGAEVVREADHDLLDLADPRGIARQRGDTALPAGRFGLPFATPEGLAILGDGRVLVVNDNNLPFSAGRFLRRADDTEFVLLRLPPGP
ncbi:MAG: esterase-like activity of phytase family protein [Xanthomonadaceae bacterium]|jgi:hypothetical protein|nr:esterase-like activity of phytase family protein [Xanthomonadaceae bacterium]